LLESHPEGRLLSKSHVVESLDIKAHRLAEGEFFGTDAFEIPVCRNSGLIVDEERSDTATLGVLLEGFAIEGDAGGTTDFF